jgi:hypothetical protein
LAEKRFSLFNTERWHSELNRGSGKSTVCEEAPICHVVPILSQYTFDTGKVDECLRSLAEGGSVAAPGFMKPEGVVVFHVRSGVLFKKTLDKNDGHKTTVRDQSPPSHFDAQSPPGLSNSAPQS